MANQYKNKILYGDQVLIDLTSDTVTADKILNGYTAHKGDGVSITGNIPIKSANDIGAIVDCILNVPSGYYGTNVEKEINSAELTAPESGTHEFTMTLPMEENDTVTLTFSVDSEGNSNITNSDENLIAAEEVSF